MDRTLVRRETAGLYMRYTRDLGETTLREMAEVSLWVMQYTAGVINAGRVAERAFRKLAGVEEKSFIARCDHWFSHYVLSHVSERGREVVRRHRDAGDLLAIVTGGTIYAARPLARELDIEHVVATELEVEDGRFTGKARYPLCYGKGKITFTESLARAHDFSLDEACFYSDSATDLPLLERVGRPIVVNPDMRLRAVARRRGWPMERW
jgi:HAD superfamily hydrolase (TIGR01490 family)